MALCSEAIKFYFNVSESDVGLLATAAYIGNVIGTVIAPFLFAKLKAKHIIVVAAILNGLSVGAFSILENFWIIFATRILGGFFKVKIEIEFIILIGRFCDILPSLD